jgi:hypothetical protein
VGSAKKLLSIVERSARSDLVLVNTDFARTVDTLIPLAKKISTQDSKKRKDVKDFNTSLAFLKDATIDTKKGLNRFIAKGIVTRDVFLKDLEKPLGKLFSRFEDIERLWKNIQNSIDPDLKKRIQLVLNSLTVEGNKFLASTKVLGARL